MKALRTLIGDWKADLGNYQGDWTRPGFQALAVHRFGVYRRQVNPRLLRAPLTVAYNAMSRFVRNVYGIELPDTVVVGRGVVIEHQGGIVIHGNARIGDGTIVRQGVTLGNKNLDQPFDAPIVGQRVNIGAGAKILGLITIGDDATVGANAVVTHDVPAGATVVGIPARIVASAPASGRRRSNGLGHPEVAPARPAA